MKRTLPHVLSFACGAASFGLIGVTLGWFHEPPPVPTASQIHEIVREEVARQQDTTPRRVTIEQDNSLHRIGGNWGGNWGNR